MHLLLHLLHVAIHLLCCACELVSACVVVFVMLQQFVGGSGPCWEGQASYFGPGARPKEPRAGVGFLAAA